MRLFLSVFFILYSLVIYANDDSERQQVIERIQPIGTVSVENQKPASEQVDSNPQVGHSTEKPAGQATYDQFCVVCHKDGLAGSPKFRDEHDWKPRLTNRTIDDLLASAIKGVNAMPAKGTCTECSDEELKAAIQYMLPKS